MRSSTVGTGKPLLSAVLASVALGLAAGLVLLDRRATRRRERVATPDADDGRPHPFAPLRGQRYVSLTTFRRSGEAVATPVWFALYNGRLYVTTPPDSGKMKRIRNNPEVLLVPSDAFGREKRLPEGAVRGLARDVANESTSAAEAELWRKYWLGMRLIKGLGLDSDIGEITLEVRPDTSPPSD